MRFYLGTHLPSWLARTDVPLFVSHRRLSGRKTFPRALGPWALDSGGFSELNLFGAWVTTPEQYVEAVATYAHDIGNLVWAAPMDWMCEPSIIDHTGLSVAEHQERTVANLVDLRAMAPDLPFAPVLQGWTVADYQRCVALYVDAGIDLAAEAVVGLGTVCRRQDTSALVEIVTALSEYGLALHGFGLKLTGLARISYLLDSADSMAWSYRGRRGGRAPGCVHKSCANCIDFAMLWRERVLRSLDNQQMHLGWAA